jgi:tripartite-type tricarboxylate transporter receptor subunit TctC
MRSFAPNAARASILGLIAAALLPAAAADAQTPDVYPAREVRVICAFPPGSGADVWVRFFAEQARPRVGKPVLVENRPGANGNIAAEYVARAKPDGYTIFIHSPTSVAANMFMFKNTPADLEKSIVTVATLLRFSFYLTVDAKRPWKNVEELVAYLRRKGDKASFATTSPPGRLMGNLFKEVLQLKAVEVPYRTSPDTLNDLTSGQLDYSFTDGVFAHAQEREGRLRILAVGSKERMEADPNIPTLQEQGVPGVDVPGFFGVMVPAGTPRPIIDTINGWIVDIVAQPQAQEFIKSFGGDPLTTTPEQAQRMFLDGMREWGRLVRLAKIKPEG